MSRPLLELLEKCRLREHDRVPYFRGTEIITLSEYEAALRAQRDEWLYVKTLKTFLLSNPKEQRASFECGIRKCVIDIDPDGKQ